MAPLPPNNTPRFKVRYTSNGKQHELDARSSDSPLAFGLNVDDLFGALSPKMLATTIDGVDWAPAGSNIFNPVITGIEGNSYGSGTGNVGANASFISFVGRSTGGRRVKVTVFGVNTTGTDWRFVPGEDAAVDAAVAALNAPANHFEAIDGLQPVWKSYANAGYNAYWQRQTRP